MCLWANFDGNRRGSPHDLEIQTFVTFGMLRAELKFYDIRNEEGTTCPYTNFDENRRGSSWMTLNLKRTRLRILDYRLGFTYMQLDNRPASYDVNVRTLYAKRKSPRTLKLK